MSNVVPMQVQPKTVKGYHKKHEYVLTFIPGSKDWHWEVTHVHVTKFGGVAGSMIKARNEAQKHIDQYAKDK